MWVGVLLCALGQQTFDTWTPAPDGDSYVLPGDFPNPTTFTTHAAGTSFDEISPASIPTFDTNPCKCGNLGSTVAWKSEDDTDFDSRRCRRPRFGWTWSGESGDDTEPLVMTIPPGNTQTVQVSGTNPHFLTSATNEYGAPCGIVIQDVFQGQQHTGSGVDDLGPSTIPSSLYCEDHSSYGAVGSSLSTGSRWRSAWNTKFLGLLQGSCPAAAPPPPTHADPPPRPQRWTRCASVRWAPFGRCSF